MVISRCCKHEVYMLVDYYVCGNCHFSCPTMDSNLLKKDDNNGYQPRTHDSYEGVFVS